MNVTYLEYKSNSYCNLCFEDRADDKIKRDGNVNRHIESERYFFERDQD